MNAVLQGLLANAAIAIFILQIWISSRTLARRLGPRAGGVAFGVLFGTGAALLMTMPIPLEPGVFVDLRSTMIGLGAWFGGPLPGVIAAAIALAYRIWTGGVGTLSGVAAILAALLCGLVWSRWYRGREPRLRLIAGFAALLAASTYAALIQLALQQRTGHLFLPALWYLLPLAVFACTLVTGLMMAQELRWRRTQRRQETYRRAIDALPDCLNVKGLDGRFLMANPATAEQMRSGSVQALLGRTDFDFYPEDVATRYRLDETGIIEAGQPVAFEQPFRHGDGTGGWLATLKAPLRDAEGAIIGLITHNRDITRQKAVEADLAETQRYFAEALANMADGLVMFDRNGRMVFCNEQYRTMFPRTADLRQPGRSFEEILRASLARGEQDAVETALSEPWVQNLLGLLREPGSKQFLLSDHRWIEARSRPGPDGSTLIVYADITEMKQRVRELKELNAELARLASTDGLTRLLNRRAFDAAIGREMEIAAARGEEVALMLTDIDYFKSFNDTYGHPAGDAVIRSVAECLTAAFDGAHVIAGRYGGEEFGVFVRGEAVGRMAEQAGTFRADVSARHILHIGSRFGHVTVSAGHASARAADGDAAAAALLRAADKALYAAKAAGRNAVRSARDDAAAGRA